MAAGRPVTFDVTVTNSGKSAGDEVAQLYLEFPKMPGAPLRALRGFQRVHLDPGASQKVHFELKPRDLSMVTDAGEPIVAEGAVHGFCRRRAARAPQRRSLNATFHITGRRICRSRCEIGGLIELGRFR